MTRVSLPARTTRSTPHAGCPPRRES